MVRVVKQEAHRGGRIFIPESVDQETAEPQLDGQQLWLMTNEFKNHCSVSFAWTMQWEQ